MKFMTTENKAGMSGCELLIWICGWLFLPFITFFVLLYVKGVLGRFILIVLGGSLVLALLAGVPV